MLVNRRRQNYSASETTGLATEVLSGILVVVMVVDAKGSIGAVRQLILRRCRIRRIGKNRLVRKADHHKREYAYDAQSSCQSCQRSSHPVASPSTVRISTVHGRVNDDSDRVISAATNRPPDGIDVSNFATIAVCRRIRHARHKASRATGREHRGPRSHVPFRPATRHRKGRSVPRLRRRHGKSVSRPNEMAPH